MKAWGKSIKRKTDGYYTDYQVMRSLRKPAGEP